MEIRFLLKTLLLPPFTQILCILLAWQLRKSRPRLAQALMFLAVFTLWALATPLVATFFAESLEQEPALTLHQLTGFQADAIVILSGDQDNVATEYGEPVSRQEQLARIRYGAFLHRHTGLPVLLSGGMVHGDEQRSLAATMAFDLLDGFGIKAAWLEKKSRTTSENAVFSYNILAAVKKTTIALVTSAYHLKRAKLSFEQAGFTVIAAPTGFTSRKPLSVQSFVPNATSLELSRRSLHEWLGYIFYKYFQNVNLILLQSS